MTGNLSMEVVPPTATALLAGSPTTTYFRLDSTHITSARGETFQVRSDIVQPGTVPAWSLDTYDSSVAENCTIMPGALYFNCTLHRAGQPVFDSPNRLTANLTLFWLPVESVVGDLATNYTHPMFTLAASLMTGASTSAVFTQVSVPKTELAIREGDQTECHTGGCSPRTGRCLPRGWQQGRGQPTAHGTVNVIRRREPRVQGGRRVGHEWVHERGTQERQQTGGGATQTHRTREPHQEGQGRAQQTRKRGAARQERQPKTGNQNGGDGRACAWEAATTKGMAWPANPVATGCQGSPCSTGIRWGVSPAAQMGCLRNRSGGPSGADQP